VVFGWVPEKIPLYQELEPSGTWGVRGREEWGRERADGIKGGPSLSDRSYGAEAAFLSPQD